jgi:hypothetical protein
VVSSQVSDTHDADSEGSVISHGQRTTPRLLVRTNSTK